MALLVPPLVDGGRFRSELETTVSSVLGRRVVIAGTISLRLLPGPAANLTEVGVGDFASVKSLGLGFKLLPLLGGRLVIDDLALSGGRVGAIHDIEARVGLSGGFAASGGAHLPAGTVTFEASGALPRAGTPESPLHASLRLPAAGASLAFDGNATATGIHGRVRLATASLRRATAMDSLPDAPLTGEAMLSISAEEAGLQDLALALGDSRATGSVVATLGTSPALVDLTLRATTIDLDAAASPPPPPATVQPAATTSIASPVAATPPPSPTVAPAPSGFTLPGGVTVNLDLAAAAVRWRGGLLRDLALGGMLEGGVFSLGHATATLPGDTAIDLNGTLTAAEESPVFDGHLHVTSGHLAELRTWLRQGPPPSPRPGRAALDAAVTARGGRVALSPLTLILDDIAWHGDATLASGTPLAVKARLTGQGLEGSFDGNVAADAVTGTLGLRAAGLAQAIRPLGGGAYRPRGGGPLALSARIRTEGDDIAFDSLDARMGETILTGQGRITPGGQPVVNATLAAPAFVLDAFLPSDYAVKGWRLDNGAAQIALADNTLTVKRLSGRLLGGDLIGAARINAAGWAGTLSVKGADIARLGLAASGLKLTRGSLDAEARLAAAGGIATLGGDGRIEVRDGVIEGFDLAAVNARMGKIDTIGNLLGLIQAGLSGGSSRFSTLGGSFRADKGVATSRDLRLVAEGGGAEGSATVDLPRDTIDARIAFALATPGTPPLGLRLDGKLDNPNKSIDVNALQRYLVEHGLGKALKGKGGGLIESLMGIKPRQKKE